MSRSDAETVQEVRKPPTVDAVKNSVGIYPTYDDDRSDGLVFPRVLVCARMLFMKARTSEEYRL